jgi:hypothetical protein
MVAEGGKWPTLSSYCFAVQESFRIGGWVGHRTGLDVLAKINSYPCRESNQGHPVEAATFITELCRIIQSFRSRRKVKVTANMFLITPRRCGIYVDMEI